MTAEGVDMECYTEFAYLYDTFMEDVPYDKWADLLSCLIKQYGENTRTVLDLGCGTGTLTLKLSEMGFDVIDSRTNFLFARHEKISGIRIFEALKERHIISTRRESINQNKKEMSEDSSSSVSRMEVAYTTQGMDKKGERGRGRRGDEENDDEEV